MKKDKLTSKTRMPETKILKTYNLRTHSDNTNNNNNKKIKDI